MKKTEAIKEFFKNSGNSHLTEKYYHGMEVQVNVAKDDGQRVQGVWEGKHWVGWENPTTKERWKSFRIPWNADSEPMYQDSELRFDLAQHVEGIGMTGWDWLERKSRWVGYDFDSIINHKCGLEMEELSLIKDKILSLPYTTLVKSTSGKGIHLYIYFEEPVTTDNHNQHAALSRSILSKISGEVGYNLNNSVDVCGGILWCYHRKQEGTDGLSLLKKGELFPTSKIPTNWRDHIEVTSGKRKKIKSTSVDFDNLFSTVKMVSLDSEHLKLLNWFSLKAKKDSWWDSDHNMLVCHTWDLKKAHTDLSLKGIFNTDSSGSSMQNCFAFPNYGGVWVVRRHGLRVKEHPSWVTDPSGWTKCVFNDDADLEICVKSNNGLESVKDGYVFDKAKDGIEALGNMGVIIDIPEEYGNRRFCIKEKKNKLIISVARESRDNQLPGFLADARGHYWEIIVNNPRPRKEINPPDDLIRHCVSNNAEAGWYIFARSKWILQNKSNVQTVLLSQEGVKSNVDIEIAMSKAILNPWDLCSIPFADEYPGNRKWNKDAASILVKPENGVYSTWLSLLEHVGASLTPVVLQDSWCVQNVIKTGGEYLLCWLSSMFQNPFEPLPYLFFVGEQNTGKSTLHEAIGSFLIKKGYVRADNALLSTTGFNSEIANAVLCVVEECNLKINKEAANRIKDWVTGKTISIRAMYRNSYDCPNTTHWIQCANDKGYCPVSVGDTRIVVIRVNRLKKEIPKSALFNILKEEAPAFLKLLLNLELPVASGRLAVPCLKTYEKEEAQLYNMNDLDQFFQENIEECEGSAILWGELYTAFQDWLPHEKRGYWSNFKAARTMPMTGKIVKGKMGTNNATYICNIKFKDDSETKPTKPYTVNLSNGRLVKC